MAADFFKVKGGQHKCGTAFKNQRIPKLCTGILF